MEPPPSPQPATPATPTTTSFAKLDVLDPLSAHTFMTPTKRIHDGTDVTRFLTSTAYRDIGIFVMQLNRAMCPRIIVSESPQKAGGGSSTRTTGPQRARTFPLDAKLAHHDVISRLQKLIIALDAIIDETPPKPGPRRFGNTSFREWHAVLEDRMDGLLAEHVVSGIPRFARPAEEGHDTEQATALHEIKSYLVGGFGSAQRLDYGTGHELSFLAFLGCLWKLGAFQSAVEASEPEEVERCVVVGVVEPYLRVVRRLILTYTLEPAGSHGVWGLDDHSFLPYVFGSAQLTRAIGPGDAMPQEGSVPGAPAPVDVVEASAVERLRGENMYFSAVGFIKDVKKGPFAEHSPMLYDISGIRHGWGKINKGMIKMYHAEVLAKLPVVQHFPFGSLFSWHQDPDAQTPVTTAHVASQPAAEAAGTETGRGHVGSSAPFLPRGGIPDTGPPPPSTFPRGRPGTASNQFSVTKAPWAK